MIAFAVTTYAFIEYHNYTKYIKKRELFNKFRNINEHEPKLLTQKINVIHEDIKSSHTEIKSFIQEMFKGFHQIEKIPKLEIMKSFLDNLCFSSMCNEINEKIKLMTNDVENVIGIKFPENHDESNENNKNKIKHVSISGGKLISWYRPLIFQWNLSFVRLISGIHMRTLGFRKNILNDGIIIWEKQSNSSDCILFAPSCIGGITFYQLFIKSLCKKFNKNIYVIEIPGMAWTEYSSEYPPSVSKVSEVITSFIIKNKIKNLDMFGHSFGTIVLNHIVNEQYLNLKHNDVKVHKIIYIEGLLFYVKVFKTLKTIEMPLLDVLFGNTKSDVFTMPLFQRDLHVKFYIKRYLSLFNSVLCGDTLCETECDFYALMAGNDNKFITKDYIDYINNKKLNISYKVFDKCTHGSFVWTQSMQSHLFDILKN